MAGSHQEPEDGAGAPGGRPASQPDGNGEERERSSLTPARDFLDGRERYVRRRYLEDQAGYVDLAAEIGVSVNALRRWLDDHGILRTQAEANAARHERRQRSRAKIRSEICEKRRSGQEIAAIAEGMSLGYSTVFKVLKQEGLTKEYVRGGKEKPARPLRGLRKLDSQRRRVLDLIQNGDHLFRIAANMDVSEGVLRKWMKINDVTRPPAVRFTKLQNAVIETWNTTSLNRRGVAHHLDCSVHAVNLALRKAGLVPHRTARGRPVGARKGVRTPAG